MRVGLIVLSAVVVCLWLRESATGRNNHGPSRSHVSSPAGDSAVAEAPKPVSTEAQVTPPETPRPTPPATPATPPETPRITPTAPVVPPAPRDRLGSADSGFFALDRNGDGMLSFEEMTDYLRAERERWDINGDGQIDLDEWREYMKAFGSRPRRLTPDVGGLPTIGGIKETLGTKPTGGITAPKLKPKSDLLFQTPSLTGYLPPWLRPCDTDGDGQVTLYEWKEKGGSISDFKLLDLNDDGFVTITELIRIGHLPPGTGDPTVVLPDPVNLVAFRGQHNTVRQFEVTGRVGQSIWGTDLYTDETKLAIAVVHARVLQVGETGVVKVTILEGQQSYTGSTRHGVTSMNFGPSVTSYRIEPGRDTRVKSAIVEMR